MLCVSRKGVGAHISVRERSVFTFLDDDGETQVEVEAKTEAFETGKSYDKAVVVPEPAVATEATVVVPEEAT